MSIFQLLWKELFHRKAHSLMALAVVTSIVGLVVATMLLSESYEGKIAQQVTKLDDDIRKTMKELGFNIRILPKDLNLANFFKQDFGQETMDEQLVQKLADAKNVVTINHLRPALVQKVDWPEQNRQIILYGVKGVVPWSHRKNPKKPLAQPVAEGSIILGNVLAKEINAVKDSTVLFRGKEFKVGEIKRAFGTQDDVTAWVNLATVQEFAEKPGQINMIEALNCNCASIDALAEIEAEISGVLGNDVKVIELNSALITRAKARTQVESSGAENLALMRSVSKTGFALLTVLGSLILALMFLRNASERANEVGMLRAIGVSRNQILGLFLGKSGLLGLAGGVIGLLLGGVAAVTIANASNSFLAPTFHWQLAAYVPLAATVISILATWMPVEAVTGKDPAAVLREAS